jgi:hypothetical protein
MYVLIKEIWNIAERKNVERGRYWHWCRPFSGKELGRIDNILLSSKEKKTRLTRPVCIHCASWNTGMIFRRQLTYTEHTLVSPYEQQNDHGQAVLPTLASPSLRCRISGGDKLLVNGETLLIDYFREDIKRDLKFSLWTPLHLERERKWVEEIQHASFGWADEDVLTARTASRKHGTTREVSSQLGPKKNDTSRFKSQSLTAVEDGFRWPQQESVTRWPEGHLCAVYEWRSKKRWRTLV